MTDAPTDIPGGGDAAWVVPSVPLPPLASPTIETFENAFITRFSQGPIPTYDNRPLRFMQGAVYDSSGNLVPASQKLGGVGSNRHLPADPKRMTIPKDPKRLAGNWLYGGHWNQHFGHFMIETLTTLWTDRRDFDGIVFHKYFAMPYAMEDWMTFFLNELGFGSIPVKVIEKSSGFAVDKLTVPGRAVVAQAFAHPEARMVWDQISSRFRGSSPSRQVYLSRTAFHESLRKQGQDTIKRVRHDAARDAELDSLFRSAGFQVVAPETLPIERQVTMVANADVIAGSSGSALHLSAFARSGTRILELGDNRNPLEQLPMQQLIAAVCDQPLLFVPRTDDTQAISDVLAQHGLADSAPRRRFWRRR